ncbi:alpha-beta hydrolase superfamily lysophospholipase [Roseomonas alkaliterrae]|uniref:Alpha-beta hydrolase superfamily lysophospholipase n=1 Tax=Neoroseomonas alkaliterrae TaxID=1452450 RepID=A0A840XYE8_9PROT|nr:alpha/beta hydrolase [Neoroseomonas alkaliterrae]MBB5691639.1 alpha-beta hydrolase superfamily lysophospholipase [Neoroseomonas alkaliterrae]
MGTMIRAVRRWGLRAGLTGLVVLVLGLALRIYDLQRGPPLGPWHTFVPEELPRDALEAADWRRYVAAEDAILESVRREVTERLAPEERVPVNRYFAGSPMHPPRFAQDWNRSFILEPEGPPRGVAVLLHGLTDAPFSMRHVAQAYRDQGFLALAIRMPGHGTVPAGLVAATWEDWIAATRLAVREARRRVAEGPLHLVGYSNGGALAVMHALEAIEDPRLPRAERIVVLSPMIGVTAFARFAGLAGLPAVLPRFAKTAWLDIQPEFNPFKYNSFPVNAARQTHRLTAALQQRLDRLALAGRLDALPPILTFQSVVDATVSTPAVLAALHSRLPANGSEIVLFDLNRSARFDALFAPGAQSALDRILPAPPRAYAVSVVGNASPGALQAVARRTPAGASEDSILPLDSAWPREVFSLSHVALPFPHADGLYGAEPEAGEDFGVQLGAIAVRGERGVLVIGLESLSRVTSNPFFPYVLSRIREGLPGPTAP